MAKTVKLMFDGVLEECLVRTDGNGETECITRDDRRIYFPKDADLRESVKSHNEANKERPILAEDAPPLVDEELEAWLGNTDETETADEADDEESDKNTGDGE